MKRLILLVLIVGVVLFGACAQPADEPLLAAEEAPDYIWAFLVHSFPEGYRRVDFQAETKAAVYQGKGIWAFTVYGSRVENDSEVSLFTSIEEMGLDDEAIEVMKSTLYTTLGADTEQSVYEYCLSGKCRDMEVIERLTITYQLKLAAEFNETKAVFKDIVVERFDEQVEAKSFLVLPAVLDCGCCLGTKEVRIG